MNRTEKSSTPIMVLRVVTVVLLAGNAARFAHQGDLMLAGLTATAAVLLVSAVFVDRLSR